MLQFTQFTTRTIMTVRTNVLPLDLCTVTLTEAQWSTIRTALICFACDCRVAGKSTDADHYLNAYNTLKAAMGIE
jgi:hypothetical protein